MIRKNNNIKGSFEIIHQTGEIIFNITSTNTIHKNSIDNMKNFITNANYEINVDDRLTEQQRKKIWTILDDFAYCNGGSMEGWREQLETEFCNLKDYQYFSISELKKDGASKKVAQEFIEYLLILGIEQGIGFREYQFENVDIAKMVIACIKAKRCIVTGKEGADIHHIESVGVSGYNSSFVDDLLVIPLCREEHNRIHNIGNKSYLEKYHLVGVPAKLSKGIWTDEEIKHEIETHINPKTNSDYKKGKYKTKGEKQ